MIRVRRGESENERGAAAVEFALIAGILLTIIFAIVEFGIFFSRYEVFVSAAREGARTAALRGTVTEITDRIDAAAQPYERNGDVSVSVAGVGIGGTPCDGTPATIGKEVTVSWVQTFELELPLVPPIDKSLTIQGVFQCE